MTKELAQLLNGKTKNEISKSIQELAQAHGLVIVYAYSGDCSVFCGYIDSGDEIIWNRYPITFKKEKSYFAPQNNNICNVINIKRCIEFKNETIIPWGYETTIPHEKFNLMEDGEVFCLGIVFSINDLK
jgi:hypothetical protein